MIRKKLANILSSGKDLQPVLEELEDIKRQAFAKSDSVFIEIENLIDKIQL